MLAPAPQALLPDSPLINDESTVPLLSEEELAALAEEERQQEAADLAIAQALGLSLKAEFDKRSGLRVQIERRWLDDLERYNSVYDKDTREVLESRKYGSRTFVPLTRRVCNLVEARLGDLLFPTDDRNFAVESSPVPELDEAARLAKQLPQDAPVDVEGRPVVASAVHEGIREMLDEAKRKAANMQRAIDDQLKECNYASEARKAIHDAIKLGTGIIKGPTVFGRTKRRWVMSDGAMALTVAENLNAAAARVDPWNFYPDLTASEVEESDHYERHRLTKARLVALIAQGFNEEAIERIVLAGSNAAGHDANMDAQRVAAGTVGVQDKRFNLIEFTGSVDAEQLLACGCSDMPDDPLMAYQAKVWFSEFTGDVVKVAIEPMDTGEQPYSVFNWQKDTACIFGYGLPYEMRDMQDGTNSSYRAIQDNLGLTVGPQVVVNSKKIQPANGSWGIEPNKVWELTDSSTPVSNVFGFFQIDSQVSNLVAVFNLIKGLAEEIGGPQMAMAGSEAPSYAQAGAMGMSIAFNAANVWMRRAVRNWDDQITTPLIARFVDWNMQYNPDPDVKGDVSVISRGTSALLEAEGQSQRIQLLVKMSQGMGIPLRKMINQLRQMALAMRLDPDDLLPNDEEVEQMAQQQQANQPPNAEMERIKLRQAELADHKDQREHEAGIEQQRMDMRMAELASSEKLTIDQARLRYGTQLHIKAAELKDSSSQRADTNQRFNTEVAIKAAQGSGI